MAIEVVSFRDVKAHWDQVNRQFVDSKFVYIGRYNPTYHLPASIFANPFKPKEHPGENCIELYRVFFMARPVLQRLALERLPDHVLVCWCAPGRCHGHVLKAFVEAALAKRENL